MRRVCLSREDFELFHQDITPLEYEFFKTHAGAFKRMWHEQTRRFWSLFVNAFEHFIWNHGIMKDFPMTVEESREYIDEIVFYIRDQFVDGRISTAKSLVMDCVTVAQNRNCITQLDKANYAQNPFYMKETREVFRQLFGPPTDKKTFMKVLCGLPVYVKFAGAAVACLRRWLSAENIPSDEKMEAQFLDNIYSRAKDKPSVVSEADLFRAVSRLEQSKTAAKASKETPKSTAAKNSQNTVKISEKKREGQQKQQKEEEGEEGAATTKKRKKKKKTLSPDGESATTCKGGEVKREGEGEKDGGGKDAAPDGESKDGKVKTGKFQLSGLEQTVSGSTTEAECKEGEKTGVADGSDASACPSPTDSGISSVGGAEPVAKEGDFIAVVSKVDVESTGTSNGAVAMEKEDSSSSKDADGRRRKQLHVCACCEAAETVAKSFKRCQKCKGLPNPKYYCSRDCQAKHWKDHKLDHKSETTSNAAAT